MSMPQSRTTTLTVRIEPETNAALATAARSDRRSLADMLEVMVLNWCMGCAIITEPKEGKKTK